MRATIRSDKKSFGEKKHAHADFKNKSVVHLHYRRDSTAPQVALLAESTRALGYHSNLALRYQANEGSRAAPPRSVHNEMTPRGSEHERLGH